jgi:hypothetical protein
MPLIIFLQASEVFFRYMFEKCLWGLRQIQITSTVMLWQYGITPCNNGGLLVWWAFNNLLPHKWRAHGIGEPCASTFQYWKVPLQRLLPVLNGYHCGSLIYRHILIQGSVTVHVSVNSCIYGMWILWKCKLCFKTFIQFSVNVLGHVTISVYIIYS